MLSFICSHGNNFNTASSSFKVSLGCIHNIHINIWLANELGPSFELSWILNIVHLKSYAKGIWSFTVWNTK